MNLIRKILIGKIIKIHSHSCYFVIVGVRKNIYHPHTLEILIARMYGKNFTCFSVLTWVSYYSLEFVGRRSKDVIRKCLKTNPDKVKYHIGKTVNLNDYGVYLYDDKYKTYAKYLESL